MSLKPKVALSQDFLFQLAKLPSNVHTKVLKWAVLFQTDPKSPGINYEKIHAARDPNLKSVRIDQDWRGIVFKPESGDVYVLLYVDHHDAAYKWAERRKLAINPVTGAMQVVIVEEVAAVEPANATAAEVNGNKQANLTSAEIYVAPRSHIYTELSDRELMSLGVPQDWLARVRSIQSEAELDGLQSNLPVEAYEGLFLVAAGDTVAQVLGARETRIDKAINTKDFAVALTIPESQSHFVVVDDAYREIASLLERDDGGGSALPYSAIVVVETQDFGPQALKLLRAMVARASNDLFLWVTATSGSIGVIARR